MYLLTVIIFWLWDHEWFLFSSFHYLFLNLLKIEFHHWAFLLLFFNERRTATWNGTTDITLFVCIYVCMYVSIRVCVISLVIPGGRIKDFQELRMAIIFYNQPRNTFDLKNSIGRKKGKERKMLHVFHFAHINFHMYMVSGKNLMINISG